MYVDNVDLRPSNYRKEIMTRRTIRSVVAILVAVAIPAVGLPAQAATGGDAASSRLTVHDTVVLADGDAEQETAQLLQEFEQAEEGETIFETTSAGYAVTIVKVNGKPVVQAAQPPGAEGMVSAAGWLQNICIATVSAAILGLGAAGMGFLAVSGGGVIAGIAISAKLAGQAAAVLTAGAAIETFVGEFIC